MPRRATPLLARDAAREPVGLWADGGGRYLSVSRAVDPGYTVAPSTASGATRGLGPCGLIYLTEARVKVFDLRRMVQGRQRPDRTASRRPARGQCRANQDQGDSCRSTRPVSLYGIGEYVPGDAYPNSVGYFSSLTCGMRRTYHHIGQQRVKPRVDPQPPRAWSPGKSQIRDMDRGLCTFDRRSLKCVPSKAYS
jgi:hypothetical protein